MKKVNTRVYSATHIARAHIVRIEYILRLAWWLYVVAVVGAIYCGVFHSNIILIKNVNMYLFFIRYIRNVHIIWYVTCDAELYLRYYVWSMSFCILLIKYFSNIFRWENRFFFLPQYDAKRYTGQTWAYGSNVFLCVSGRIRMREYLSFQI